MQGTGSSGRLCVVKYRTLGTARLTVCEVSFGVTFDD